MPLALPDSGGGVERTAHPQARDGQPPLFHLMVDVADRAPLDAPHSLAAPVRLGQLRAQRGPDPVRTARTLRRLHALEIAVERAPLQPLDHGRVRRTAPAGDARVVDPDEVRAI